MPSRFRRASGDGQVGQSARDFDRAAVTGHVSSDVGPLHDQAEFLGQRMRVLRRSFFGHLPDEFLDGLLVL